jgi:hypothetical protein
MIGFSLGRLSRRAVLFFSSLRLQQLYLKLFFIEKMTGIMDFTLLRKTPVRAVLIKA